MRFKQVNPISFQANPLKTNVKYRQYSHTSLTDAYLAVKEKNFTVSKASRGFQVPMQTLRDRVLGKIDIDTVTTGRVPVLSLEEEAKLVSHLKDVANLGYGYSRQEVVDIASDYAYELGKRPKNTPLTLNWFVKFAGRWPEIRVLKPRALDIQRAKSTSSKAVDTYFDELEKMLIKYDLEDKPHLIFNVDEKGITQDHKPPYIVAGRDHHPQAVTAGRSKTTTLLGCGSAAGLAIPPYFVFSGKRMLPELMSGATPGASGTVSETGWSNSDVFQEYLQEHFIKFIPCRNPGQHILLLLDGHKSHISIGLLEWAKSHEIILFILPAHTSHILQPLDVGCYGPFQKMYHNECHKFMRNSYNTVTRYDICSLACKVYSRALSGENLFSAFMKTGIFPFNKSIIPKESTKPAEVFNDTVDEVSDVLENEISGISNSNSQRAHSPSKVLSAKLSNVLNVKKQSNKSSRNYLGKIVSGQAITETNIRNKIIEHKAEFNRSKGGKKNKGGKHVIVTKESNKIKREKTQAKHNNYVNFDKENEPGPSHINLAVYSSESESDMEISDDDKCCVCNQFTPSEVKRSLSVIFTKWVKCDGIGCSHWTHLKFCTDVSVIRRCDTFFCIHCEKEKEE